jgi:1,4-dihydroxy-2-naphthoyl-CoA hydrolase
MPIWLSPLTLNEMTELSRRTASEYLRVTFTGIGDDWVEGSIPFDDRTQSTPGTLHHGALAVLVETLGSVAAAMCVDLTRQICLGQILHQQHPEPAVRGPLSGRAVPLSLGAQSQLWEIQVRDGLGTRVCIAQLTLAVLDRPPSLPR